jgi:hypothetical protein
MYYVKNSLKLLWASKSGAKVNCNIGDFYVQISNDSIVFVHTDGTQFVIDKRYLDIYKAIGAVCKIKDLFQ